MYFFGAALAARLGASERLDGGGATSISDPSLSSSLSMYFFAFDGGFFAGAGLGLGFIAAILGDFVTGLMSSSSLSLLLDPLKNLVRAACWGLFFAGFEAFESSDSSSEAGLKTIVELYILTKETINVPLSLWSCFRLSLVLRSSRDKVHL